MKNILKLEQEPIDYRKKANHKGTQYCRDCRSYVDFALSDKKTPQGAGFQYCKTCLEKRRERVRQHQLRIETEMRVI